MSGRRRFVSRPGLHSAPPGSLGPRRPSPYRFSVIPSWTRCQLNTLQGPWSPGHAARGGGAQNFGRASKFWSGKFAESPIMLSVVQIGAELQTVYGGTAFALKNGLTPFW